MLVFLKALALVYWKAYQGNFMFQIKVGESVILSSTYITATTSTTTTTTITTATAYDTRISDS